jgi:hypothetical protein
MKVALEEKDSVKSPCAVNPDDALPNLRADWEVRGPVER